MHPPSLAVFVRTCLQREMDEQSAVCSIVSRNYLAQARVFARSVKIFHPDMQVFVLLVDEKNASDFSDEPFTLITLDEIGIPDLSDMCARYSITELNTAVKPFLLQHLMESGIGTVLYFDPDIQVFASLEPIFQDLTHANILLTPHILQPIPAGIQPAEAEFLQVGAYNLGFIGVKKSDETQRFLSWWQEHLKQDCRIDKKHGLFVDQRWIDLVPGLFEEVHFLKYPGCNVAYWNLHERIVRRNNDKYSVNELPLIFYHFSGYKPEFPSALSKYHTSHSLKDLPIVKELCDNYAQALRREKYDQLKNLPYAFSASYKPKTPASKTAVQKLLERRNSFPLYRALMPVAKRVIGLSSFQAVSALLRKWEGVPSLLSYKPSTEHCITDLPKGINMLGYFTYAAGVGQAVRLQERAIQSIGVPHVNLNLKVSPTYKELPEYRQEFSTDNPYDTNILHINADRVLSFTKEAGKPFFPGRRTIGMWAWELETFPEEWKGAFAPFDEIWTYSDFGRQAIAAVSSIPVYTMPLPVIIETPVHTDRRQFGLPDDRYIFLFVFDMLSAGERKNPLGVVRAFQKAFLKDDHAMLVIKCSNGSADPEMLAALQAAQTSSIRLIDTLLPREQVINFMSCCDAYVSLHRSEGFGLTLAEAMLLGKPVIATDYSSTTDFLNAKNGYPVAYTLITIDHDHGLYRKGSRWAEPSIDDAAEWMRYVYEHQEEAKAKGAVAAEDIRREYSLERIGKMIEERVRQGRA